MFLLTGRLTIHRETMHRLRHVPRVTDSDGRCMQLYPEAGPGQKREDLVTLQVGKLYKVVFKTKGYFESTGRKCFYPWVEVPTLHIQTIVLLMLIIFRFQRRSPSKFPARRSTTTYHCLSVHTRTQHTGVAKCSNARNRHLKRYGYGQQNDHVLLSTVECTYMYSTLGMRGCDGCKGLQSCIDRQKIYTCESGERDV